MAKGKYEQWLTEEGLLQLEAWARNGLTDEQIAANMGITRSTLNEWKKKYSDISDTLKRGKDIVDIQVENALLKRALGYTYIETTQERVDDYDLHTGLKTGSHMEVTKTVTKEVQPDTTAQIFWLKNRKPDTWRDKRDVGIEGTLNTNNPFADLSTEDLKKLINHD
jgi:transcriptional regulator with XRE-family HTH domain